MPIQSRLPNSEISHLYIELQITSSIQGQILELILLEMGEELDRADLAFHVDLELDLEREIGGDPLPFTNPNILLDYPFQAVQIQLRRLLHMVNLQRHLNPDPFPNLSRRLLFLLFYRGRGGGEVGGDGDLARDAPLGDRGARGEDHRWRGGGDSRGKRGNSEGRAPTE